MERLFHVSEEADIQCFAPRPDRDGRAVVWAISEARLANYLLPRDCPRVCYTAGAGTTANDQQRFLGSTPAVIAIEAAWWQRCRDTTLAIYHFDPAPFRLDDAQAGYFVTPVTVRPEHITIVEHPLDEIRKRSIELRVLAELWTLREAVVASSLAFSIIRMRNAARPPSGFESRFPLPR